jgi:hypothetical protein
MSNARTRYIERARRKSTAARQQRIAAEQAVLAAQRLKEEAVRFKEARRFAKVARRERRKERARRLRAEERDTLRTLLLPADAPPTSHWPSHTAATSMAIATAALATTTPAATTSSFRSPVRCRAEKLSSSSSSSSNSPYSLLLQPLGTPTNRNSKLIQCIDGGWFLGQFQKTSKGMSYRHGFGYRFYKDGSVLYRGFYKMSRFHGYGERFSQGGRYMHKGMFAHDQPHGQGRGWDLDSGRSFDGAWSKGKPSGMGMLYASESSKTPYYMGMMHDWLPHGEGQMFARPGEDVDGVSHLGAFVKGRRHGDGVGVWPLPRQRPGKGKDDEEEDAGDTPAANSNSDGDSDSESDSSRESDTNLEESEEMSTAEASDEDDHPMSDEVPGFRLGALADETKKADGVTVRKQTKSKRRKRKQRNKKNCTEKAREAWMRYSTFRFKGLWKDDRPFKKGVLLDSAGRTRFQGRWDARGLRQGPGVQTFADGATFEGSWLDDLAHGPGVWKGKDGSILTCIWSKGQRCGHGDWKGAVDGEKNTERDDTSSTSATTTATATLKTTKTTTKPKTKPASPPRKMVKRLGSTVASVSRASHVGEWRNGAMNGPGEWWGADGSHYVGGFKNNKKHGEGTLQNADGTFLKGKFKDGQLDGVADLYKALGDLLPIYRGPFQNGEFEGDHGVYRYGDGCVYEGQWKHGKRHGHGTFRLKNGTAAYEGGWADDKMHGPGLARILGGVFKHCIYKGTYVHGKRHTSTGSPPGEISDKNGKLMYRGGWKNDDFHHTEGEHAHPAEWFHPESGETYVGGFVNGARQGYGEYHFEDGREYEGEWFEGEMQGRGKLTHPDNFVEEGTFRGNRLLETDAQHEARMYYELALDWLSEDTAAEAHGDAVEWARAEAVRRAKEEWEREDPEFEANRKIEQMRLEKLRQLEARRVEEERRKKMVGAIRARDERKRKQDERRSRCERRAFLKALKS